MGSPATLARSLSIVLWMAAPVAAGWLAWKLVLSRRPEGETRAARVANVLSQTAMLAVVSPLTFLVFWVSELPAGKAFALPFVGLFAHLWGGAAAWGIARFREPDGPARAASFLAGASSNILTFGGLVAVLLLGVDVATGERALAEIALYRIFEAPFYFLAAWPAAARMSAVEGPRGRRLRPVTLLPLLALAAGWAMNLSGVPRPRAFDGVAGVLVRANVILMGLTVGLTLRRAAPLRHLPGCLWLSAVKFALVPAAVVAIGWLLGYRGLTLQVMAIGSAMPVAFMAIVASNLLHLDQERIGTFWLFTNAAMVVVIPSLALLLPAVGRL